MNDMIVYGIIVGRRYNYIIKIVKKKRCKQDFKGKLPKKYAALLREMRGDLV